MEIAREEANALYHLKKKILSNGFSCAVDRFELAASCIALYKEFLKLEEPRVFVVNGPNEAFDLVNHLIGKNVSQQHEDLVEYGVCFKSLPIHKLIDRAVFEMAKFSKNKLKELLGPPRFAEVRNVLFGDLNFQFSRSVHHVVEKSFYASIRMRGEAITEFSAHPSFSDRDWLHFHRGCSEIFETDESLSSTYFDLINSGLFSGYFYDDFAVLVPVPERICKNENLVLHNEDEVAVHWSDGTAFAYWNGVQVPQRLICEPEKVTADDILDESNAEVRRCYLEKLGSEKFGNLLGLISLDKKQDRFGNELVLYRTEKVDNVAGDFIYFAKVVCPSTGRNYFLCVPPGLSGVEEAVSWTFGKTPRDYRPSIET